MRSFLFAALFFLTVGNLQAGDNLEVVTSYGSVNGFVEGESRYFRGIPYARPPVGELRWQPPRAPKPWEGTLDATRFGPSCVQRRLVEVEDDDRQRRIEIGSEDCLTLNIATPVSAQPGDKLPVMVWIHGGGFIAGTGSTDAHSSRLWNADGVILVTFNYRLGALGFFAHESLDNSRGANYGLMDMVAALKWVSDNIAAFGGDPERVTIAGVSAGGMSVHLLMATPLSKGLFHGAIAQSGYGTWPLPRTEQATVLANATSAEQEAAAIAARAVQKAADDVPRKNNLPRKISREDLYNMSPRQLVKAVEGFHRPIVDGISLPDEPGIVFKRGQQQPVPLISGGNGFDGSVFPHSGMSVEAVRAFVGSQLKAVSELYNIDWSQTESDNIMHLFGDMRYVMAGRYMTEQMHKVQQPGYRYLFDYVPLEKRQTLPGAPHASEMSLLFNDTTTPIANTMRQYWINFIKTGNPNGKGLPQWQAVKKGNDQWMVFRDTATSETAVRKEKLDFLESVYQERVSGRR